MILILKSSLGNLTAQISPKESKTPPIFFIVMMFELSQGMDEVFSIIKENVEKFNWLLHIDEEVKIYNTSRTSLFFTCLLSPANAACLERNQGYLLKGIDNKPRGRYFAKKARKCLRRYIFCPSQISRISEIKWFYFYFLEIDIL